MYLKCIPPLPPIIIYTKTYMNLQTVKILFSFAWAEIQAKAKKSSKFIFIHKI